MGGEILSFEEILEKEKYILFDTSSQEGSDWYARHVFNARSFSGINVDVLRQAEGRLERSLSFLSNPNVYTVPGVIPEYEKARAIVQESLTFLGVRYEHNKRGHKHRRVSHPTGGAQRDLLRNTHELFHNLFLQSKKSLLKPEDKNLYQILERVVIEVAEKTHSKIDFGPCYGNFLDTKDFNTDEQLVAMSLYLSLKGNESCIITSDSDIRRILVSSLQYLLDPKARGVMGLEESLEKSRIRIYYPTPPGEVETHLDTEGFEVGGKLPFATVLDINQGLRSQLPIMA